MSETFICHKGSHFWYLRSEEELERIQTRDAAAGYYNDSAGEPLLYSKIGREQFKEDTVVTILRRRGIPWPHWTKKPKHLIEGLATIKGTPRIILFSLNPVQSPWRQR